MEKKQIKAGEVWTANFPYEDKPISKLRPVMVLSKSDNSVEVANIEEEQYLSVKITGQPKRDNDDYDTVIVKWKEANLNKESVARVSKTMNLPISQFKKKIGDIDETDFENIISTYLQYLKK